MTTSTRTILVCPTTHIDWDWNYTFEQYYASNGDAQGSTNGRDTVHNIFGAALSLFSQNIGFAFSVAEVGFLRRYCRDNPSAPAAFAAAGSSFCLMGGGITSPDNLVCHGELFLRNYLVGRAWLSSVGLTGNLYDTAWLPDDFGHDPQLPVVLSAMGLTTLGLSRLPGSPQGTPCAAPIAGGQSVAAMLNANGVVFTWKAGDGSTVTTLYMPDTYGTVGYLSYWGASSNVQTLDTFVTTYTTGWPNGLMFVPVGVDFATPSITTYQQQPLNWVDVTNAYNASNSTGVPATTGTWKAYMDSVSASGAALPVNAPLYAQNYWTGYFASRPALKSNQGEAVRALMSAEVVSAVLRMYSGVASSALDALDNTIWLGWEALAPSSHHDYVTGTSPDNVYYTEQLPASRRGVTQGRAALDEAMRMLAEGINASPQEGEIPVVVANTLGFTRARGLLATLPNSASTKGVQSVRTGSVPAPVQRAANGDLLFMASPPSMGYETVYLSSAPPQGSSPAAVALDEVGDEATIDNGVISVTLTQASGWGISALSYRTGQTTQTLFAPGGVGNQIRLYTDTGNIYQFGNEPLSCPAGRPPGYGTFAPDPAAQFVGGGAQWIERGPLRWRLSALVNERSTGTSYQVEYTLVKGEPFVRMTLTGSAPSGTSVVVAFPMVDASGAAATSMIYGTPHYQEDVLPVPYWPGPTFVATHHFVIPTGSLGQLGAIYHGGIPAWTLDDTGTLLGTVLRNTPAGGRGASGSDNGVHTQHYILAVPSTASGDAVIGAPLKESLSAITPLEARVISGTTASYAALPTSQSLASVAAGSPDGTHDDTMVRVARVQAPAAAGGAPSCGTTTGYVPASMVLRVYVPSPQITQVTLDLPFLSSRGQQFSTQTVTALEAPLSQLVAVTGTGPLPLATPAALTTLRVAWCRPG